MSIFTGSAVAIVTPFKKDGSVDYDKFRDVIEYQIAGGTDCIVVCGTTGESSTLSHEEHLDCIRFCAEVVNKRIPVVAGTVCLDLEGVLVPEIWIAFAEASGIPELKKTTRDEPDYDKLMTWRLGILKEHGLGLKEIQETIAKIDPIPGAKEFLDELRSLTQVIIISDTFAQFATPLMKKLGWPTIFCNSLEVAESGEITGFKMRCEQSKLTTVKALQSIGFETIASGDSYNDLGMIKASKAGFLFKSTEQIKKDNPELAAYETYDELLAAIKEHLD